MRSNRVAFGACAVLSTAVCLVVVVPLTARAACAGDEPEAVLACYTAAYETRDADAIEALLAPDYVWIAVTQPRAKCLGRDETVEATRNMLNDSSMTDMSLTYGDGYRVVQGDDPDTWRIENLVTKLAVQPGADAEPYEAAACTTLYVRRVEGGYEIYREVTFEGTGCGEQ
jgi:ketosteroid isomerase-like protein